jgi:hypothetical protein
MAHLVETHRSGEKEGGSGTGNTGSSPKHVNMRSSLSIRNGVLLYKHLICPMMDYACPVWRSAAHSHIQKLQVLQSKCLRIATNSTWYIGNKQTHDDLGVPYFADHIRQLTERFYSKLTDVENPLVARSVDISAGRGLARTRDRVIGALIPTLTEGFRDFPQLQGKCQGAARKTGHVPHIPYLFDKSSND